MKFSSRNNFIRDIVKILIGGAIACLFLLFVYPKFGTTNNNQITTPTLQLLATTTFDTVFTFPSTTVSVTYPGNGYYGLGASPSFRTREQNPGPVMNDFGVFFFGITAPFSREQGVGMLYISFAVAPKPQVDTLEKEESLYKASITSSYGKPIDEAFLKEENSAYNLPLSTTRHDRPPYVLFGYPYFHLNGHDWFVYHEDAWAASWTAIAVGKKEVIFVNLEFQGTDAIESQLARGSMLNTFLDQLEHVDFE